MATATQGNLLAAVEEIRPIIEAHATQAEEQRRLPDAVYDAMLEAGLFRAPLPKALGGLEQHPVEIYRLWEAVARIDTAAGWCLALGSAGAAFYAAYASPQLLDDIFAGGPDVVLASGFFPPGTAAATDGGWRVTAHGRFASGVDRADWIAVTAVEMERDAPKLDPATGEPASLVALLPRDEVDVIDTWHTLGMRGTGSNDVAVSDAFVPAHRAVRLGPDSTRSAPCGGPLYAAPYWLPIHGETVASLGAAGAAIDKLVELGTAKVPTQAVSPLRTREMAQHHAGKADALVFAARSALHASISELYRQAEAGAVSLDAKIDCQLAACFVAEACAQAVLLVHEAAGTSGVRLETGLDRHLRDALTMTQHISKSYQRYESVGRHMFGMPHGYFGLDL